MICPPFLVPAQIDRIANVNAMPDSGCNTYGLIDSRFVQRNKLQRIPIEKRKVFAYDDRPGEAVEAVVKLEVDVGGIQRTGFVYEIHRMKDQDLILGLPWLKDTRARIEPEGPSLFFPQSNVNIPSMLPHLDVHSVSAESFKTLLMNRKKNQIFSASMVDIDKALRIKEVTDPRTRLPEHYHQYLDVFDQKAADQLPPHRPGADHKIELNVDEKGRSPEVPYGPLYQMTREELLVLRKTLTELLDKGFIRVSNSPAAAPVLFAKQPSGKLRFCVDYRALNALTKKDRYPLPLINETLERIGKATWFTKLDVIQAYYKLRIAEGDEWMTAFRTRYGLFEWLVTPLGLANAPSTFQKYINWCLRDYLDEFVSAYIDDILVFTTGSLRKHREHVSKVLERLRQAGLQISIDKCEFETHSTKYLGFIIETGKGVRMDPEKVKAILDWASPTTVKGVRAFLGFANFYRRFIKEFSAIVAPLTRLTSKDVKFHWSEEANGAFERLKKAFTCAPVLMQFDPDRETVLEADASGYATGGVLSQYDEEGVLRPCAFFSQKNSPAECNYEIYEKELLAIIKCTRQWSAELRSAGRFRVLTDHKNLTYFATHRRLKERQMRWAEELSQYNFSIAYRPGKEGGLPDALSRREQDMPQDYDERLLHREASILSPEQFEDWGEVKANVITVPLFACLVGVSGRGEEEPMISLDDISNSTKNDLVPSAGTPEGSLLSVDNNSPLQELWNKALESDQQLARLTETVRLNKPRFSVEDGVKVSISECSLNAQGELCFRDRRWVPNSEPLRTQIMQETHDSTLAGHPGRDAMYAILARQFYWPGIANDVRRFVRNCHLCSSNKVWRERKHGLLKPLPIPERKWREISIDFITELPLSNGCTNLAVITDRLGKGNIIEPMEKIDADTTARMFIRTFYRRHGLPSAIVSDRGSAFVSALWIRICQLLKITRRLSTAYHPESDGATERMNAEVEAYLRMFIDRLQEDWALWSASAELALNNRESTSTGISPFFLDHGYHLEVLDLTEEPRQIGPAKSPMQKGEAIVSKMRDALAWAQSSMAAAQSLQEEYANRHRQAAPVYNVGDKVWLDLRFIKTDRPSKKLDIRHRKFKVLERIGSHAYRLDTPPGIHNVFHTWLLRPAADDPFPSQVQIDWQPPAIISDDGEEMFEVEAILDDREVKRGRGRRRELLVKWTGYAEPTWEPADAMEEVVALDEFERLRGLREGN